MFRILLNLLPSAFRKNLAELRNRLFDRYAVKSYSQEGEDLVLQRLFSNKESGFYIDVGAHHPQRFSNTCFFYMRGWNGINIEPNPEAILAFQKLRSRDINLQLGVAELEGVLTYHVFDEPALNTFDSELAAQREITTRYRQIATKNIPVRPLAAILKEHLPIGINIDFMSIDAEGMDLTVMRSNDWECFRPTCVLVESLETTLEEVMQGELNRFMRSHGYVLYAKTVNTLFFLSED